METATKDFEQISCSIKQINMMQKQKIFSLEKKEHAYKYILMLFISCGDATAAIKLNSIKNILKGLFIFFRFIAFP